MKKILLLSVFALTTIISNGQTVYKSLNGYIQADAEAMIAPFNKLRTQPSQLTNVWFDKKIIENMVDLLNSEVKTRKSGRPDGIRVYFAYDNSHNETVVLVSTYDSGLNNSQSPEGDNYHYDYYDHPSNAALFTMTDPINGEPCHDPTKCVGAELYVTSGAPDDPTCTPGRHYLTRTECEQMVQEYANSSHKIDTRGEWFDLDLLNEFADAMKKDQTLDGLRIYFARHPATDQTYYEGDDAFVLVPTKNNTSVNPAVPKQDYFNCSITNHYFKSDQSQLRMIKLQSKKGAGKGLAAQYKKVKLKFTPFAGGGQDNGELCPNNCD